MQQFRHRAYDPRSARWLQEDPIGLSGGVNLYRYNNGNPVRYSDPYGMCTPWPECMFQWMADQAARHGGVSGSVALNVAAGLNAASEAVGFNALGLAIETGDAVGVGVSMASITPAGRGAKALGLGAGAMRAAERTFSQGGARGLRRMIRSYEKNIAIHEDKIIKARQEGGFTSSMEREVRSWRDGIAAAKTLLGVP